MKIQIETFGITNTEQQENQASRSWRHERGRRSSMTYLDVVLSYNYLRSTLPILHAIQSFKF